jgi:hypothetical protein
MAVGVTKSSSRLTWELNEPLKPVPYTRYNADMDDLKTSLEA